MKSLIASVLLSVLVPLTASAIPLFPGPGVPDIPFLHFDDSQIFRDNGRVYIRTPEVCKLTHVLVHVTGDDVRIDDLDVMYARGERQDIGVRETFREGSFSRWKRLSGDGTRCIVAFSIKASSRLNFRDARVHLYGLQQSRWGGTQEVKIGSVRVRDLPR